MNTSCSHSPLIPTIIERFSLNDRSVPLDFLFDSSLSFFVFQLLNEMLEHSAQMEVLSQKIHRFDIEHKLQSDAVER